LLLKIISPLESDTDLGKSFSKLRAVTVFPEPDSPTKATVLPLGILNETELMTF